MSMVLIQINFLSHMFNSNIEKLKIRLTYIWKNKEKHKVSDHSFSLYKMYHEIRRAAIYYPWFSLVQTFCFRHHKNSKLALLYVRELT